MDPKALLEEAIKDYQRLLEQRLAFLRKVNAEIGRSLERRGLEPSPEQAETEVRHG